MLRLYKDLQIKYRLCYVVIIIFFTVVWILSVSDKRAFIFLGIEIVLLLGCNICFELKARNRMNATTNLLNQQCRVQDYLKQILPLLERAKDGYTELFLAVNLSAAYLNLDDTDKALFYLQYVAADTEKGKLNHLQDELMISYYRNYAVIYARKGNMEAADVMLAKMRSRIDSVKMTQTAKQMHEQAYKIQKIRMQILQENYEGVEEYCRNERMTEQNMLTKIFLYDILRDVYLHEGRQQEAQECREFILQNGGDTYYVAKVS